MPLADYGAVVDHTIRLFDQNGERVVVASPYLDKAPAGFAEACEKFGVSYTWFPETESWYGFGTSRVEFRAIRKH